MTRAIVQRCILLGALLVLLGGIVFLTPTPTQEIEDSVTQETVVETTLPSRPPEGYQVPSRPEVTFPFTHVSADRLRLDNIQKLPEGKKVAVIYPYTRSTELVSLDGRWKVSYSQGNLSIVRVGSDSSVERRVLFMDSEDDLDGETYISSTSEIVWSWDSKRVFYRVTRNYSTGPNSWDTEREQWIESVDIATGEVTRHTDIGYYDDLRSYATARYPHDPVLFDDSTDYRREGLRGIKTRDGSIKWIIDRNVHPASLSPNKQMVLMLGEDYFHYLVYTVVESGLLYDFRFDADPAESPFLWSPDGTKFAYHQISRRDGHTGAILESELYLMNIDGTGRTKLTDTPDIAELLEGWTPDGRLVFSTKEVERVAPNGRLIFSEESDWHVADLVVE